jgi:hypothetical protein
MSSTAALASGSSSPLGAAPTAHGPARDWNGTQIRGLDCPVPPLPQPVGCPVSGPPGPSGGGGGGGKTHTRTIPPDQILSNEMSFTQWAYVHRIANIYWLPSTSSHQISKLHWYTEDGFNEIYILLRAHWDKRGHGWVKIRIPGRPNGRTGWVQRNALGRFHVTHDALVVSNARMHMYFYVNGQRVWSAPVGVGAPGMPTPTGHFWIRERFVISDPGNGYYPYAFGTADYSTLTDWPGGGVVGIHGPFGASAFIPGHISHGCIRLKVPDDFWLGRHLQLGTPLRVV